MKFIFPTINGKKTISDSDTFYKKTKSWRVLSLLETCYWLCLCFLCPHVHVHDTNHVFFLKNNPGVRVPNSSAVQELFVAVILSCSTENTKRHSQYVLWSCLILEMHIQKAKTHHCIVDMYVQ